jgi:pimeloyl-ACP methyl ester carboxylesterase
MASEWDGVVGPKTWAMLDAWSFGQPNQPPFPVPPIPVPPIIPVSFTRSLPVIVLPGILGTRLRLTGVPDWDPDNWKAMGKWVFAKAAPKLTGLDFRSPATLLTNHADPDRQRRGWGALPSTVYSDLLEELERGLAAPHPCAGQPGFLPARHPVWAFGYDWRQSNLVHAARLAAFIDKVLEVERAEQVILVTHSMGGLVVRAALPKIADKVRGVVHAVQPAVGAVAAARRVHTGFHPFIDKQLGELFAELAEAADLPLELPQLSLGGGEPTEASLKTTLFFSLIYSDGLLPNPIYYGRLMARAPSAVELMPSDAAGAAKADWLRPSLPAGSIHDHYATAAPAAGGMILPGLPAADSAEFRKRLADAKAFHSGLGYHPITGVLFGTGLKTDNAFNPSASSPEVIEKQGDGTVPAFSGRCPDLATPLFRVGFPKAEHVECLKDSSFLAAIVGGVDHIAQGGGALREGVRPDRARCHLLIA